MSINLSKICSYVTVGVIITSISAFSIWRLADIEDINIREMYIEDGVLVDKSKQRSVSSLSIKKDASTTSRNNSSNCYSNLVKKHSENYKIDYDLIKAVIITESNCKKDEVGSAKEIGLMQVKPMTQDFLRVSGSLYNPDVNIEAGAKYLRLVLDSCDNKIKCALIRYNRGHNTQMSNKLSVDKGIKYFNSVLNNYAKLKSTI